MSDSPHHGSHHSTDSTPTSEHSGDTSSPKIGNGNDIPEGLEPLADIQSIHVQQQLEMLEIVFGVETENRYSVFNNFGQRIYFAGEKSDYCDRQCYGANRPFVIYVFDCFGKVVIQMERNCTDDLRCWGAGLGGTVVDVKSALTGELYGTVSQNFDCSTPNFSILDADGNQIMSIVGPSGGTACGCIMRGNAQFTVFYPADNANEGQQQGQGQGQQRAVAGVIMKQFGLQEFFSDATTFGVSFDAGLDVRMKAVLIGATFAIDFAFFEEGSDSSNNVVDNNPAGYGGGYGRGRRGRGGRGDTGGRGGGGGGKGGAGCSICSCVIYLIILGVFAGIVLIFIFLVHP